MEYTQIQPEDSQRIHYHVRVHPWSIGLLCGMLMVMVIGMVAGVAAIKFLLPLQPIQKEAFGHARADDEHQVDAATVAMPREIDARTVSASATADSDNQTHLLQVGGNQTQSPEARPPVLKGVCYAAIPVKARLAIPDDDLMDAQASAVWSREGRGDLSLIRALGANAVRMYGNDPNIDHREFLDAAQAEGLQVIATISNWPYVTMPGNCLETNYNCYRQIKDSYMGNLYRGFLDSSGEQYHPALRTVILMHEPELHLGPMEEPWRFCRGMLSSLDAILDAEKEMAVIGPRPNISVSFAFEPCPHCTTHQDTPALGRMLALFRSIREPDRVGYKPRNDLWEAYKNRFENSFTTQLPAGVVRKQFIPEYQQVFHRIPVFISEYHARAAANQTQDLEDILALAANTSNLLTGINFFEFQVRYDRGADKMLFGMFGLGDKQLGKFPMGLSTYEHYRTFEVWCLEPMKLLGERCGPIKHEIEQVREADAAQILENVSSADDCCRSCIEAEGCGAWTWLNGTVKCRLANSSSKQPQEGVAAAVSGLPGADHSAAATEEPSQDDRDNFLPAAVAHAFGGHGPASPHLCQAAAPKRTAG